MLIDGYSK